jgi:hypothetical protein
VSTRALECTPGGGGGRGGWHRCRGDIVVVEQEEEKVEDGEEGTNAPPPPTKRRTGVEWRGEYPPITIIHYYMLVVLDGKVSKCSN